MEKLWLVLSMTWQPAGPQRAARRGLGGRGAREKREKRDEERTSRVSPSASTHDSDIRYHHFEIKDGRHAPPRISMRH